jgi:hypothetical protein
MYHLGLGEPIHPTFEQFRSRVETCQHMNFRPYQVNVICSVQNVDSGGEYLPLPVRLSHT